MIQSSKSEEETTKIAADFSGQLKPGDTVCLSGDLGVGKSVFARSIIRTLCGKADMEVPSPTFTLLQMYDATPGVIYHFDLYRLDSPEEIYELGWEEAVSEGITLVEWPERLEGFLPEKRIEVTFETTEQEPDSRRIRIERYDH